MCGIAGELRFDGQQADLAALARMMCQVARRGPDHAGSFSDGPLGLGHQRLSILDLSIHGHQPMVDREAGLALVFNGTIYNHPELRDELRHRGHRFNSTGDTEVILRAWAEWGPECVKHFRGMFAFALWEMEPRRLWLVRDRFGIKPLYYSKDAARIRFASSSQALLAGGGVDTTLDPIALHHQFTLHAVVPAPRTVLNGIRKLPPAHMLCIAGDGTEQLSRYWELTAHRPADALTEDEWAEALRGKLMETTARHQAISDVPVGVLLSGGLDSSLLVGLLAAHATLPRTFSIGFEDQPEEKGSEFEYSDLVVERFGTQHTKIHIPNEQVLTRLPEAIDAMNEPMVGQDAVAFYLLAEQVSQHVKVVQSGQGADEVFAGYFWYPKMAAAQGTDLERFAPYYFDRDDAEFQGMVTPPYRGADHTGRLVSERLAALRGDTYIDRVLAFDVTTLIVDDPVKRVDNMTMAWGLEARVPFLDHELVELAMQIPPELKMADGGKGILKKVARGMIPDGVIDRPKGYFPVPALKFVRGAFLDFMRDILNSQACRERGLYERAYVDKLLSEPDQHFTRLLGSKLWHLALLELWLQRNVDRQPG
ncbi:N-acetylglutaminylglutamine amidotransferase [Thiofaba sp. EF100]|uniref:N-acetylglutaminylglutamine amidotransferase n=1 Tax=Thiofaba sp. EF100 TaxID=3121274 RepID=UPI0032218D80